MVAANDSTDAPDRGAESLTDVSLAICSSCFFLADCASTLEKYGSRCQSCFPALTLRSSGPALRTTPQLGVTILMPALVALGRKKVPRWKLPRQLACCIMSVLESSACYVWCSRQRMYRKLPLCLHIRSIHHESVFESSSETHDKPFLACDQEDCPLRDLAKHVTLERTKWSVSSCSEVKRYDRTVGVCQEFCSVSLKTGSSQYCRGPVWITTQPQFVLWIRVLVLVHRKLVLTISLHEQPTGFSQ